MAPAFEQGPIRPPSEAQSLLIRVTRNCPWNRCRFCPVYKGERFSRRDVDEVLADLDAVARHVAALPASGCFIDGETVRRLREPLAPGDEPSFLAALHWYRGGMRSIFLQDADSLRYRPDRLERILARIREHFPWSPRVTCYSRSSTLARHGRDVLARLKGAGLDRVHVGLESGSDAVLALMAKGVTAKDHIKGCTAAKEAGLDVSVYLMPGLGGKALSAEHARESAHVVNRIRPHFLRLRSLAVIPDSPLAEDLAEGRFEPLGEDRCVAEIRDFMSRLDSPGTTITSDHILNLLENVKGVLPDDQPAMLALLDEYLALPLKERLLYRLGRRMGVFSRVEHLGLPNRRARAEKAFRTLNVTETTIDRVLQELMANFV